MMPADYVLYGAPGTGSVAVEAALTLIGAAYRGEDVAEPDLARAAFTPMAQVPALRLPDGRLMTESAAILIWLTEAHPDAKLAPAAGEPRRADFLRWMAFVSAAIHALYWIRDDPSRVIADPAGGAEVKARLAERIAACWAVMEAGIEPGRYLLGETLTVLDLYVTVVSRWTPRRRRFYETAPRMSEVVRRVDADPRLAEFWARRFAFADGWEG